MRRYIRHPSEIPIEIKVEGNTDREHHLKDIGRGGLAFHSRDRLQQHTVISIRIPTVSAAHDLRGSVAWCRQHSDDTFEIGITFDTPETAYRARLLEQLCHIEQYRREVERTEDRELSSEEAAREWIARFAARFPR